MSNQFMKFVVYALAIVPILAACQPMASTPTPEPFSPLSPTVVPSAPGTFSTSPAVMPNSVPLSIPKPLESSFTLYAANPILPLAIGTLA